MKIELKGIFDSLVLDNVTSVSNLPKNARDLVNLDNCIVSSNNKFLFFRGYMDENNKRKIFKTEWSYDLEIKIKNII